MTYSIVKSIETMMNRFIHRHTYGRNFSVTFLDTSPFNRKERGEEYLKAATYGAPTMPHYAATIGVSQEALDELTFLNNDVLGLYDRLKPLQNSSNMSAEARAAISGNVGEESNPGRPSLGIGEISDKGEESQDRGEG